MEHGGGSSESEDYDAVNPEAIEMLLGQVGKKTQEGGWVLKVDEDVKFAQMYPQTVIVHFQYWEKQIELFRPMIERYRM